MPAATPKREQRMRFLMRELRTKKGEQQDEAVRKLAKFGKFAVPYLIEALSNKSAKVREESIWGLELIGDKSAAQHIQPLLKDRSHEVRWIAASALGDLEDKAAEGALIECLSNKNSHIRLHAASSLGKLKSRKAVAPLIALLRDSDEHVRASAAYALGKIGDPRAVKLLRKSLLREPANHAYHSAKAALVDMGILAVDQLIRQLRHERHGFDACYILGKIGTPAVPALIKTLDDTQSRDLAISALAEIKDARAVRPLIRLLADKQSGENAKEAIIQFGEPAVEVLAEEFGNLLPWARQKAADIFGRIGSQKAVEPLLLALNDSDAQVRHKATWGLGQLKAKKAVGALMDKALNDQSRAVRRTAVEALQNIGDVRAADTLISVLKSDRDGEVRAYAADALGGLGVKSATDALIEALADPIPFVRGNSSKALQQFGVSVLPRLARAISSNHVTHSCAMEIMEGIRRDLKQTKVQTGIVHQSHKPADMGRVAASIPVARMVR